MISAIHAYQRLDSRGKPTVQVRVTTEHGTFQAIVPSRASKGDHETHELRDRETAYGGNGVLNAVKAVEDTIAALLIEKEFKVIEQDKIDRFMIELDGTEDKSKVGANAILGVSMACARAGAASKNVPLYQHLLDLAGAEGPIVMPVPFFNVLNGGIHSGNEMAFQEFMIAPVEAESITDAVRIGAEVFQELKNVVRAKYGSMAIGIGDEGGFAPPISRLVEALDLLVAAIENCGYTGKVKFGIDPASSEFLVDGVYDLRFKDKNSEGNKLPPKELGDLYRKLINDYPIVLLEDPFGQDDWEAWTEFNKKCEIELVGDDLLATNVKRIKMAEERGACNALLLKINQIGTITEAIEAANLAYSHGWRVFVSHRSGETTDDFIADLTVGLGTGHLKAGVPCRGERVAKYNRLMDIEDEIKRTASTVMYARNDFRQSHKD